MGQRGSWIRLMKKSCRQWERD